jgi:hypothetical protein
MDSISNARNFFINQQGLSSDEADLLISKGLESYNQQRQPQTMMQMVSNGGRIGLADGGISPLASVFQNNLTNNQQSIYPRIESIENSLGKAEDRIGQPSLAGSTDALSLSNVYAPTQAPTIGMGTTLNSDGSVPMAMGGRAGYEMGGITGIPQTGGAEGIPQMDEKQALAVILQMLLQSGIPMEEAKKLAQKIIELFSQGGEQAVLDFANQLEQQEAQQMASGGIAGYAQRQGYFLGSIVKAVTGVVKGVANVVKSIAKSPIGKMALTVAAVYFGGPMLAGGLGISGAAGAALAGGLANTALQLASGKGFNPLEALISAGGAYAGAGGFSGTEATAATKLAEANVANYVSANPVSSLATAEQLTNPAYFSPTEYGSALTNAGPSMNVSNGLTGQVGTGYATPQPNQPFQLQGAGNGSPIDMRSVYNDYNYPNAIDKFKTSIGNFGTDMSNNVRSGIENLSNDPLGTIGNYASRAYNTVKENALPIGAGLLLGNSLNAPQVGDTTDEDEQKRQEELNALLTYYGRNAQVTNPYFYSQYGARNPFETAAQGGIMGYKKGGSMVPPARQIEGGVIELDARKSGGYIPYGKKERHDDVPAMLAKDEFVFTSRAVKAAGGGSAQRGAAKMYALMKQLEGART